MRTLVVGAGGMLGQDVVRVTGAEGLTRAELDVTDRRAVREAIGPDHLVINCAAWTDVDGAEEHPAEALRVNRDGARNVAEAAGAVAYLSTDYVFDGRGRIPYLESDPTGPLSSYGRSKLEGERATAAASERHFIVRSSWLFGAGGKNFVETMLRSGTASGRRPRALDLSPEVRVVDDQVGCPTFTGHLAEALAAIVEGEDFGMHHMAASGSCSWFEFAQEIFARAGKDVEVAPCTSAEFPRPAERPAWSVLGSERGHSLPHWRDGLQAYLGVRV
ncbi:MAG: dTDP-4-dehydrorhamnose reductase [Thermoleophilaceae bacterium]